MSIEITYRSQADQDYSRLLPLQKSLKALRSFTKRYDKIAADAHEAAMRMTEEEFPKFREGVTKEKSGEFAGVEFMEKWGCILLPEVLMQVGLIAHQFGAPFGVAYIRMKDLGRIKEDGEGRAVVVSAQGKTGAPE
jgi:folate-dependent tRNA-U54 methylase TrmFO/GidA